MDFFELEPKDISDLTDSDLRELVARLCEAELIKQGVSPKHVAWGGAQEAPDGGLDVAVTVLTKEIDQGFIPKSHTGFQVKKHTMGKAACKKEMQNAQGNVKPIIDRLANQSGAYLIVSGKDDCTQSMSESRIEGMEDAIASLPSREQLFLDFYGRDRLSSWLRQYPSVSLWVRSRLGKPLSGWKPFGKWACPSSEQADEYLLDDEPCFIDRSSSNKNAISRVEGVNLIRRKWRGEHRVIRLIGLSGVGKTRFVQALFEDNVGEEALPQSNVIYADLGDEVKPTASQLISYLLANDYLAYVVLDNCPPDVHRTLQKQVSAQNNNLRLLTIEYDISDDQPEETKVFHLEPSSEQTVGQLVQNRFPKLDWENANKVAEFSGGNARLALALAGRVEADESLSSFTDEDLFQRLFSQRKGAGDDLFESAEALALVYSFNTSRDHSGDELSVLSAITGIERRRLYKAHKELLRRGIAQKRGEWCAILPHALANRLAARAFDNIPLEDIRDELLNTTEERLFQSCIHRLAYLHDCKSARQLARTWIKLGILENYFSSSKVNVRRLCEYFWLFGISRGYLQHLVF